MTRHTLFTIAALLCLSSIAVALDNGDGTYTNPMIHADYPDCEVIRVGEDYYFLSSSFHLTPANPIMHSKDLVNWKPVGFTIPEYPWDPRYNLNETGDRYGAGSWAPTLRYHNGMFYSACYVWTDHGEGVFYVTRAKNIEGPWVGNLIEGTKLYDPGLFFDDDGKVYVIHGQNDIYVTELDAELTRVVTPPKHVYPGQHMFEGAHAYKINGKYYLYCTGSGRQQCLRADNIYGPYEHKTVCDSELDYRYSGLHQGALIDTPTGEWWAVIFQDRGKHGRIPNLLPVTWEDGWPITHPVFTHKKPDMGKEIPIEDATQQWRSDDFSQAKIGLQWQWNHRAVDSAWSLTERPGWLRLKTPRKTDFLRRAQNTLVQHILGPDSGFIVKMDISQMKDGDFAGAGLFSQHSNYIGIECINNYKRLIVAKEPNIGWIHFERTILAEAELTSNVVWLKAEVPYREYAIAYSYSFDGVNFISLGKKQGFTYEFFVDWLASRYCIFNFTTRDSGGYVDIDSFDYILPKRETNLFVRGDKVDAQLLDNMNDFLPPSQFRWVADGKTNLFVRYGGGAGVVAGKHGPSGWQAAFEPRKSGAWIQFYRVDFGVNPTAIDARFMGLGTVEIRLDSLDGELIAEAEVDCDDFTTYTLPLKSKLEGVQNIVLVFRTVDIEPLLFREFIVK